jgi:hypothetical protein
MTDLARLLIVGGLVLVVTGLVLLLARGTPLGRLPGDLVVHRGRFTLYFPLATSLLLSLGLSLAALFLSRRR